MGMIEGAPALLVKAPAGLPTAQVGLGAAAVGFTAEPLFPGAGSDAALGATGATVWQVLTPTVALAEMNPWDLCHQLLRDGLGVAGAGSPEFAEPDFLQRWSLSDDPGRALALAASCAESKPPDQLYPRDANRFWFRDSAHGQFDDALAALGAPTGGDVRIAHLDTGYDPGHSGLPVHLETTRERNFVESDRPNNAHDTGGTWIVSLGHGTGTLGVLAGQPIPGQGPLGAVPFAKVVPIRVADDFILFRDSAVARAFHHVRDLCADPSTRVHVLTMSMGGVASQLWAEEVNALYDAGVFVVTAAGNNQGNFPTRNIVFPARFGRVVAACGVMANGSPYADLLGTAGNYGPSSKMWTAMAGYTPNIPWARWGCANIIDFDGAGTSCATPQIAAAAAIWIQKHKAAWDSYSEDWMRVQAVRKALFDSARGTNRDYLGQGEVRALAALNQTPAAEAVLRREPPDSARFPLLRLFFGQTMAEEDPRRLRMLELEALQLSQSAEIERVLPDPLVDPSTLSAAEIRNIQDALAEDGAASSALREALRPERPRFRSVVEATKIPDAVQRLHLTKATNPEIPQPTHRRLRVFAYDPSLATQVSTLGINEAVLEVPWEEQLEPGPVGEYVEVVDVDPASGCCYAPVDLNQPRLLAQNGLAPSESNPQFHQQMAYAVAMKTIERFEHALGRAALWSPRIVGDPDGDIREHYVQRLRIYPHAVRATNAFYSPDRKALLLGYFLASEEDSGDVLPGGLVFTALSHDIIAHETTHALLDGLHRRFREPTNPDVLAFHEAFADIVALFQHFSMPEALRHQIAETRGDLGEQNLLAKLAVEFGQATRRYGALRDAIGKIQRKAEAEGGVWVPENPSKKDYKKHTEPHDLGAVLVAAVFDAFLQIYRARTADLVRLATGGSGVLPPGALPVDLVERLAREASKVATHVLNICIRALDYCPPVDLTFGEYLRALVTADRDLVPDDRREYRVAFVSAFRARGIYPAEVRSLSVGSLVWEPPPMPLQSQNVKKILADLTLDWDLTIDRKDAYQQARANAYRMQRWLMDRDQVPQDEFRALGFLDATQKTIGGVFGELRPIEVHSVRPARRVGPDGQLQSDLVVEITQTFRPQEGGRYRGGCTLLIDLERAEVRYLIRKRVDNARRFQAQLAFATATADDLRGTYFMDPDGGAEPFALLHRWH